MTGPMDTLGDRMRELHAAGWIQQLSVSDGGLSCDGCRCWAAAHDVTVDAVYLEGDTSAASKRPRALACPSN